MLSASGGIAVPPQRNFPVLFGRNEEEVHVCVGTDDQHVSRIQGRLVCHGTEWWLRNESKRLPIQLPGNLTLLSGQETAMPEGYSALFLRTGPRREHLVEVRVVASITPHGAAIQPQDVTAPYPGWQLEPHERLVLAALAQRYLRQERYPQPVAWKEVALQLDDVDPASAWNAHKAENVAGAVRERLSKAGVAGLTRAEIGEPVGNTLKDNLIRELLNTGSLVPPDLRLLGDPDD